MEYHRVRRLYSSSRPTLAHYDGLTRTVLSSAGDDGRIRIWKSIGNAWRNVGSFTTYDGDAEDGEDGAVLNAED
jgi:hypothetical protein